MNISFSCSTMLVPHSYTHMHHMFVCPHDWWLPPPLQLFTRAKAEWVFLRSAITPSAEYRQQNYLVGTPSTPIPHSTCTLSQWEIKQNHLDRSGTNTCKPFVCHTWRPQMDFHHTVDWKFMLIYTSIPLSPNIAVILPAMKWPYIYPCCPYSTNLPSLAFDDTTDMMWCSLITRHVAQHWLFEIAHAPYAYFIPPLPHCRSNE